MRKRAMLKTKRPVAKVVLISLVLIIALALASFIAVFFVYPAILRNLHRIEADSGIDSMEIVEIGGIPQVLYFRGQDVENPAILFIHGGPGFPEMPVLHGFQHPWEEYFTIVHWDQRNAGKTFFLSEPEEILQTMSLGQALADAYEVTQHIRETLNKDQIILLGYSWGSVLGSALAQAYPQYFSAYIGLGQVINMRENERVGFEMLLDAASGGRNIDVIEALYPYPPYGSFDESFIDRMAQVRGWQVRYGLAMGSDFRTIWLIFTYPHYSLREKWYFMNPNMLNYHEPIMRALFDEIDVRDFGVDFEMPVFIIMGDRDYQTPHILARDFFDTITAPHKEFFLIPDAGHAAHHDNRDEFNRILIDVIRPIVMRH